MKIKLLGFFYFVFLFLSCASSDSEKRVHISPEILPSSDDTGRCEASPEGMLCVKGGDFVSPSSNKSIRVDTFYIDQFEITHAAYQACVQAKGCKPNPKFKSPEFSSFNKPGMPAVPLNFEMAYNYCKWNGKRLPTETEWEKAYIVLVNQSKGIDCSIANIQGCQAMPREVGSYGGSKIFDMEGNVSEWVNDWGEECKENCKAEPCAQTCLKDVTECSGRFPCGKMKTKIVKGGGYDVPAEFAKPEARRLVSIDGDNNKIGARCVSDTPYLTNAPAWMIKNPPPVPTSLPPEPSPSQLEIAHNLVAYDTLDKPFCDKPFTSPAHCRDPVSYIKPNEARNFLFAPYVKNLRGGYVGIAADANYSYISYAKSEWVFLMDFDYVILNLHRTIRAFIKESPTVQDFLEKWNPRNRDKSIALLDKYYTGLEELPTMKTHFQKNQAQLYDHYKSSSMPDKTYGDFGWLRNPDNYAYIRHLYLQDRISIHGGDLLKDKTLYSIGEAAKKLGIKIRILYPSNAEEFWKFNENFKRNVLNLPFDEASIVVRTVHEFPWHVNDRSGSSGSFWHYVVHGGYNYQKKLQYPDYYHIEHFKNERIIPTERVDFSTIHLPSSVPTSIYGNK